jgi:hypothetical protein
MGPTSGPDIMEKQNIAAFARNRKPVIQLAA